MGFHENAAAYITAGGVILAALIPGFSILWTARKKRRDLSLYRKYLMALLDLRSFIALERLYSARLGELQGATRIATKDRMRKALATKHLDKPSRNSRLSHVNEELRRIYRFKPVDLSGLEDEE